MPLVSVDDVFAHGDPVTDDLKALHEVVRKLKSAYGTWGKVAEGETPAEFLGIIDRLPPNSQIWIRRENSLFELWVKVNKGSSFSVDDYEERVVHFCDHMAALVEANGFGVKDPHTKTWLDAGKRVFARAEELGLTDDKVFALADWATSHDFWRMNIRGVPKFQVQYDRLREQANQERLGASRPNAKYKKTNAINDAFGD